MNYNTEKALKANPLSGMEIHNYQILSQLNLSIDMSAQAIISDTQAYESMSEEEDTLDGMRDLLFSALERFNSLATIIHDHNSDLYSFNVRSVQRGRSNLSVSDTAFCKLLLKGI